MTAICSRCSSSKVLRPACPGRPFSTSARTTDRALDGFDPSAVARYDEAKILSLLDDPGIVRNRLKVRGTVTNARAFLEVASAHGSFADYLWAWVDGTPVVNRPQSTAELPARTELSDRLGKDLKRRGFTFVGSTIVYSFLQAVGLVDDHLVDCAYKVSRRRHGGPPSSHRGSAADAPIP